MKITWLGHGSFRLDIAGEVILLDPWLKGNPVFPDEQYDPAIKGATHILVTHGHFDHTSELEDIATATNAKICGVPELTAVYEAQGFDVIDFNKGGTIHIGDVAVTMVAASHASSIAAKDGVIYAGTESGFMIAAEGHTIYATGDTDIMADMEWMGDLHNPDIGLLCAGGHYTMDMARAAYAAKRYFNFKIIIPCHYYTFGLLEQNAQVLIDALPDVNVIAADVMVPVEI